jgi:hypothetical protein
MTLRFCSLFVAGMLYAFGQPVILDTPASRTFQVWLEAFNSGDEGAIKGYLQKYEPGKTPGSTLRFRRTTGGFDVIELAWGEPLYLLFRLKERNSETTAAGRIDDQRPIGKTRGCSRMYWWPLRRRLLRRGQLRQARRMANAGTRALVV